jgi:hypothetical protein
MMPMSSPWWFDELSEYMTEEAYQDLSEEISRTTEIVHGHVRGVPPNNGPAEAAARGFRPSNDPPGG